MIDEKSDRSLRQEEGVRKWLKNKGVGILEYATGVGKTRCALLAMKYIYKIKNDSKFLIIVPSKNLQKQWLAQLPDELIFNTEVLVINSAIKMQLQCNMLILDEIHKMPANSFINIFHCSRYNLVLGLTATLHRSDSREKLITEIVPVIDTITVEEAMDKGWLAKNNVYKVLLEVDDFDEYRKYDEKFNEAFSFFNFNFQLAMNCMGNVNNAKEAYATYLASTIVPIRNTLNQKSAYNMSLGLYKKKVMINTRMFSTYMRKRKDFVANHTKKFEVAKRIIEARSDKKIITFNSTIKNCEMFKSGYVVHSKRSSKKNDATLLEFNEIESGVIHTAKSLDAGADIKGLSVAIILYNDSSAIRRVQRYGRVLRKEGEKEAEIFSLIIKGTKDEDWFDKSSEGLSFMTIDEKELNLILDNQTVERDRTTQKQNMIDV